MTVRRAVKRMGVFGHVGNANLGDEAIIGVVIQNIRRRDPSAEIVGFTLRPSDTRVRHGIEAFPIRRLPAFMPTRESTSAPIADKEAQAGATLTARAKAALRQWPWLFGMLKKVQRAGTVLIEISREPRFLFESYRHARGLDLLLVAGSSQLIDYVEGGAWGHPYTILKWVLIAKARGAMVAFVSSGVGPVQTSLGRLFVRTSLRLADYRSYRDRVSSECAAAIGVVAPHTIEPDLVYGLTLNGRVDDAPPPTGRPVIGINPVPFSDPKAWVGTTLGAYTAYVNTLADTAGWLIQRGYAVMFFPTQLRADPPVIADIRRAMRERGGPHLERDVLECQINSFDDLVSALATTEMNIATRFHGIVFSYLLNKPVIGIAYATKTKDLMTQMGHADYVLDIFDCSLAALQERFVSLEVQKVGLKGNIARTIGVHQLALEAQYDRIFQMLGRKSMLH